MAKWSRAPGHFLGGSGFSTRLNFKFSDILFFLNVPKIWENVEFIPIHLIIFKAPPVQI